MRLWTWFGGSARSRNSRKRTSRSSKTYSAHKRSFARRLFAECLEDRRLLAAVSESGTTLNIALNTSENLGIVSNGSSYNFTSNQSFTNGGGLSSPGTDFSAFGSSSLVLQSAGLARYSTISITDVGGAGSSVT